MRSLILKCPATGQEFSTGIEVEEDSFKRLQDTLTKAICPHCGQTHTRWTSEGHLDEDENADPELIVKALDRLNPAAVEGSAGSCRFTPPWSIEETGACFIVRDGAAQALAYVYYEEELGRRSAAKLLSKDEAWRMAANVAKLPELLKKS